MNTVPAVKIALIFGAGIFVGDSLGWINPTLFLACTLLAIIIAIFTLKKRASDLFICLSLFLLGILIVASTVLNRKALESLYDKPVLMGGTVGGVIYQDEDRKVSRFRPDWISEINSGNQPFTGSLRLMATSRDALLLKGSRVVLAGEIHEYPGKRNPGGRNLRREFARDGILGWIKPQDITNLSAPDFRLFSHLRDAITGTVQSLLPPRQAGLLTGMLLGDKSAPPDDLKDNFRRSGLYHLLAVSGLHVGYLFALFTIIISPFSLHLRLRRLVLFVTLWGYVFLTNANPPTVRAALMISFFLLSYELRSVPRRWNLWGGAALLILFFTPNHLFKPGFQLSFAAMAGVLLALDVRERMILKAPDLPAKNLKLRRLLDSHVGMPLLVSLCAVIFTAPILVVHFGGFAPIAVALNLIAIPLAGAVFGLAWVVIFLKMIFGLQVVFLATSLELGLKGLESLAHLGSNLPGNAYADHGGILVALILVGILLGTIFLNSWKHRLMVLVSGFILFALVPIAQSPQQLRIEFLDVGQGDATLLRFPGGYNLLIDCGSEEAARFQLVPSFRRRGINRINTLLISHFDVDHAGGALEVLQLLRVDRVLVGRDPPQNDVGKAVVRMIEAEEIPVGTLTMGDTIAGFPNTKALVLWPPESYQADENRRSIVMKLTYGETDVLFTGDISHIEEEMIRAAGDYLQSEILKVPHHGSKNSSSRVFLELIKPDVALVSCGFNNPYGHPSRQVLRDLRELGATVHRTDEERAGIFASDGASVWRVSWR